MSTHTVQRNKKGPNEGDFVTWEVLQEALSQQKSFYDQMLDRMEASFKSFTNIVLDSANTRIDRLVREVQDLRTSLQFSQKEFDDLKFTKETLNSLKSESKVREMFTTKLKLDSKTIEIQRAHRNGKFSEC